MKEILGRTTESLSKLAPYEWNTNNHPPALLNPPAENRIRIPEDKKRHDLREESGWESRNSDRDSDFNVPYPPLRTMPTTTGHTRQFSVASDLSDMSITGTVLKPSTETVPVDASKREQKKHLSDKQLQPRKRPFERVRPVEQEEKVYFTKVYSVCTNKNAHN